MIARADARERMQRLGWVRAVKWVLVVLLAARLVQLLVAWLRSGLT
jgi:hypothetical protein